VVSIHLEHPPIYGCDSVSVVQLNLSKTYNTSSQRQICNGDSSFVFGSWKRTAGLYTSKLKSIQGCDSILNINLQVNPVYTFRDSFTICNGDSVVAHNKKFKIAGTFVTSFKSKLNCDSSYITTIRVNPSFNLKDTFTFCQGDSVFKHGKKFKTAGTFTTAFKTR
jgi:rRNA maturation protein Nop10